MSDKMDKGFDCSVCHKHHEFGFYVAAHWHEPLVHTCDCGAKHTVLRGTIKLKSKPKRKAKQ